MKLLVLSISVCKIAKSWTAGSPGSPGSPKMLSKKNGQLIKYARWRVYSRPHAQLKMIASFFTVAS